MQLRIVDVLYVDVGVGVGVGVGDKSDGKKIGEMWYCGIVIQC